jgi:hypothetical protein
MNISWMEYSVLHFSIVIAVYLICANDTFSIMCSMNGMQQVGDVGSLSAIWPTEDAISEPEPADANAGKLLSQMHDLSFMLKDELSIPDKPVDHSKS